mmetsp:Transcript_79521/g.170430  ORF Transcript_79521/g.170430 Transcript_79521/m.170430 type:complete len:284 (+) Transcript_79521:1741-2592(+)
MARCQGSVLSRGAGAAQPFHEPARPHASHARAGWSRTTAWLAAAAGTRPRAARWWSREPDDAAGICSQRPTRWPSQRHVPADVHRTGRPTWRSEPTAEHAAPAAESGHVWPADDDGSGASAVNGCRACGHGSGAEPGPGWHGHGPCAEVRRPAADGGHASDVGTRSAGLHAAGFHSAAGWPVWTAGAGAPGSSWPAGPGRPAGYDAAADVSPPGRRLNSPSDGGDPTHRVGCAKCMEPVHAIEVGKRWADSPEHVKGASWRGPEHEASGVEVGAPNLSATAAS